MVRQVLSQIREQIRLMRLQRHIRYLEMERIRDRHRRRHAKG